MLGFFFSEKIHFRCGAHPREMCLLKPPKPAKTQEMCPLKPPKPAKTREMCPLKPPKP